MTPGLLARPLAPCPHDQRQTFHVYTRLTRCAHRTELRQRLGRLWGAASLRIERGPSGLGSDLTSESQDESQPSGSPSTWPACLLPAPRSPSRPAVWEQCTLCSLRVPSFYPVHTHEKTQGRPGQT